MYDYVDGKVDWMAYGLPVEGDDGPFLGDQLVEVPTCDATHTVADARQALDGPGADAVVVLSGDGLVVGEVDGEALAAQADDVPLLDVMSPVPSTVRPSVTVASVARAGGGDPLVTSSDGRLLGRAAVEAADEKDDHEGHDHEGHEGHDHEGHGQAEAAVDMEPFEEELGEVMKAVAERFGEREPDADELRAFLRERLVAEGRSGEEADRFLDGLEVGDPG